MSIAVEDVGRLIAAIDALQSARYMNAAATTFYLYDILITLDEEVEHIWSRLSFSLPTLLYIINRYISFGFFLVSTYDLAGFHGPFHDDECRAPKEVVGMILAHTAWTGMMTIRVCALWRQKKWLVTTIWALWPCTLAAVITLGCLSHIEVSRTITYNLHIRLCATTVTPHIVAITPIAPTIYELFVTTLTVIKALDFTVHLPGSKVPVLFRVLARDGVAYFVILALISLANMVTWFFMPASAMFLFLYLYWAVGSTLMSRMVLNLRAVHCRTIREQSGANSVSANVALGVASASGPLWEYGSRFINEDGYLGVDATNVPTLVGIEEEEPWNVQVFDVPGTPPIVLQNLGQSGDPNGGPIS